MTRSLTRSEAQAYRGRWRAVRSFQLEELRALTVAERLAVVESLREFGSRIDNTTSREAGEEEVRQRWIRLRSQAGA